MWMAIQYGVIGESFPLEAATRVQPSLPPSVLQRAAELCRSSGDDATSSTVDNCTASNGANKASLAALTASLEKQKSMAIAAREEAEAYAQEMATCRFAMIDLAKQYDRNLGFWESRATECFNQLQNDKTESLELLGATLEEIRVSRKRVQSQVEKLRERGLRLLPSDYILTNGESVIIVDGKWDGAEGTIVEQSVEASSNDEVLVAVSMSPLEQSQLVSLHRHQVAIWDYDSVFDDWEEDWSIGTSREDSKRRLNGILSKLSTTREPRSEHKTEATKSYTSSRQRKAPKKRKKNE